MYGYFHIKRDVPHESTKIRTGVFYMYVIWKIAEVSNNEQTELKSIMTTAIENNMNVYVNSTGTEAYIMLYKVE